MIYVGYDAIRGLFRTHVGIADRNAQSLYRWERATHLDPEHLLNQGLHHLPALAIVAAYFYVTLHFIVTPVVLIWLYRAHPEAYRHARTTIATATIAALVIFWRLPVTPPRLLPHSGIRDTLADIHQWGWWSGHTAAPHGLGSLVNEFAAMPSLHVGWALWSGYLIARYARRRWVRVLGAAYPVLTTLVVMSTGNHYFVDTLAGAVLIVVAGLLTTALHWPSFPGKSATSGLHRPSFLETTSRATTRSGVRPAATAGAGRRAVLRGRGRVSRPPRAR